MALNILIVEDNRIIGLDLKRTLIKNNLNVVGIVSDELEVIEKINTEKVDILLMDIFLQNNQSGINIVKKIYKKKYIPVIYISGNENSELLELAIETKPLAYFTKPFREIELISTIKLNSPSNIKKIAINENYSFNKANKYLFYKNKIVNLTSRERSLISLLIGANERAVSFAEIENEVWLDEVVSNDALRVLVSRLRKKLKDDLIETVYSYGFKLKRF